MKGMLFLTKLVFFTFFLIIVGWGQADTVQGASTVREFYKGKKITIIVHYAPGGGYDSIARTLAPFVEKYTGADKVIIRNVPGAGGLNGMNVLWETKPNGLTIGLMSGFNFVTGKIADQKGAKFDLVKYTYLGRINPTPFAFATSATASLKTLDDVRKLGRPFRIGTTGKGSAITISGKLLAKAAGLDFKFVYGYGGSAEVSVAIVRGDLDGITSVADSILTQVKAGNFYPVLYLDMQKSDDYPNTPSFNEVGLTKDGQIYAEAISYFGQLGRIIIAPPGMEESSARLLKNALWQALSDPEFAAKAGKINQEISPLTGEQAAALIHRTLNPSPEIKEVIRESYQ